MADNFDCLKKVDELETIFSEPLHMCDVKPHHFGLSAHGRAKVLDSDSLHARSVVERALRSDGEAECAEHADCDYFDCRGECDLIEGRCSDRGVANDNLQAVCENVLFSNSRFVSGLLLDSLHMPRNLRDTLRQCANPSGSKTKTRTAAGDAVRRKLNEQMRHVVEIGRRVEVDQKKR